MGDGCVGYFIYATGMPGPALCEPARSKPTSAQRAVLLDALLGVNRTGGVKPTSITQQRAYQELVGLQTANEQGNEHTPSSDQNSDQNFIHHDVQLNQSQRGGFVSERCILPNKAATSPALTSPSGLRARRTMISIAGSSEREQRNPSRTKRFTRLR